MQKKSPYDIIKSRYLTEKTRVLQELKDNTSNRSVAACSSPKYAFIVDKNANKREIARAIEEIYAEDNIKVKSVNTLIAKPKQRRVRGRVGFKSSFKKAIVTLSKEDRIEEKV